MELKDKLNIGRKNSTTKDWTVTRLGDNAIKIGSGITPKGGASVYKPYGRPFIRSQNVGWGILKLNDVAYIDEETHSSFNASEIKVNDILLNITGASIGRCAIATKDIAGGNVNQHVCIIRLNNHFLLHDFVSWVLLSDIGQRQIESFQAGGNREGLNFGQISSFKIPMPPTKVEQTAIAKALNDADTWIQSLTQLIAKKREIKQGVMHELLSPKDNWIEKKLNDVAILKARIGWQGLTTAEYLSSGNYYLVTGTEFKDGCIDWGSCYYVDEERYKQDKNIQLQQEDVLVTKDGTIGKVAYISALDKPATLNSGVFVIRPKKGAFEPLFFYYILCSKYFSTFLNQLSAGSTINHLYQKDFVNFSFKSPRSLGEQKDIASVLSAIDSEICELEKKLEKAQQIKQGMMQNLLTGRIRLI